MTSNKIPTTVLSFTVSNLDSSVLSFISYD